MTDDAFEWEDIPFKDLTLAQFVYGELCIFQRKKGRAKEEKACLALVKNLMLSKT